MAGDLPQRSDHELLAAYRRGEAAAFDELYHLHRDWVVALAYRFTGDSHEALDVLQETFAYLVTRASTLTLTAPLRSFLYPVVKHISLASRRKLRRRVLGDAAMSVGRIAGTEPEAPGAPGEGDTRALAAALEVLPELHKEALLMRVVDGMTMLEIASALSIPVGTVKSRLHHALAALRQDPRTRQYFLGEDPAE